MCERLGRGWKSAFLTNSDASDSWARIGEILD